MYAPHAGTRTIARQRWEAAQKAQEAEKARRNAEAHAKVIASLGK